MKVVNVNDVLKILYKYGTYIFVTDEKKYSDMVDEISNLKAQESKSEWEHDHEILKAYSDGADEVLDKIRVEINAMFPLSGTWLYEEEHQVEHTVCKVLSDVLQIIDKYKAEIEPQESEDKE